MTEISADGIVCYSKCIGNSLVVTGPSINAEISIKYSLDNVEGDFLRNQKNDVREVFSWNPDALHEVFVITLLSGEKLQLKVESSSVRRMPAGSSINVAFVLNALGVNDLGIIGAVGPGRTGKSLITSMADKGLEMFLFRRQGTALTLAVRHPRSGETTLFCWKPKYHITEMVRGYLCGLNPRLVFATSVRGPDLEVVEEVFSGNSDTLRVLNLNKDLIRHENLDRVKELIRKTSILQLNEIEAGTILCKEFAPEDIKKLADFGADITIVTCGSKGSVALESAGKPMIQPAIAPDAVRDTTGAGDVHLAAIAYYHFLKKIPLKASLRMAGWLAACKVAFVGPWSGIPSKEKRQEKLKEFWPEGFAAE